MAEKTADAPAKVSKVHKHPDASKAPDPSEDCPRCNHFRLTQPIRDEQRRMTNSSGFPDGIDQARAYEILVRAFPKSYNVKSDR